MKTRKVKKKIRKGGFFTNILGKILSDYVLKQGEKARELQKKGIKVIKTPDMKIGKKYRAVIEDGVGEFTVTSIKLDDEQAPTTDPDVRIMGKTYIIMTKERWFSDLHYANEWFVEVDAKHITTKSRRRSNHSRKA